MVAIASAAPGPGQVIKSPQDHKLYKLITLPNGLTALLISDPAIKLKEPGATGEQVSMRWAATHARSRQQRCSMRGQEQRRGNWKGMGSAWGVCSGPWSTGSEACRPHAVGRPCNHAGGRDHG